MTLNNITDKRYKKILSKTRRKELKKYKAKKARSYNEFRQVLLISYK